jgi:Ca-activated chloride channel family protein
MKHRIVLALACLALAAAPASAEWPAWVEKLLFNPSERTERALESFEDGEPAAAGDPLETALRLRGDDPAARYNAGTGRLAAGRGDAAQLLDSASAAEATGLASRASYNLGNARMAANDLQGAIDAFQNALRRDSTMEDAKFNLELAQKLLKEQQQQQDGEDGPPQENEQGDEQGDEQQQDPPQDGDQDQQEQDQQQQQDQEQQEQQDQEPQDGDQDPQQQDQEQPQDREQQDPQQQQQKESPLPQFEDLPDMTAEEAAAILEAIENMEREQRRQQAVEAAKAASGRKKDW